MKTKLTKYFFNILMIISLVLVANMIGITPIYAADPIAVTIDPVNQYQTLEGWGTSLCWWANVVGGWNNNTKKNEIIDLLFDSTNGLGLNIARYNIGGGENPGHEHMRPGAEIPGYKITEGGGYDWNADANQRWCLQQAKNKGVNIFEAFTNSPPYWMTKNGCSAGSDTLIATNNLKDDYYDNFADYITEVIKHFKDYWGITFRTISPMNEPIAVWWGSESNQEGCHYDRDKQNLLIKEVGSSLSLKGLTDTKISAPEEYCTNDSKDSYNSYDSTAKSYISQVNTHTYTYKGIGNDHRGLKNAAANGGKRIWMSEVTCPFYGSAAHDHNDMTASMDLAANIMKSLKELEAVSYVYWQAVEDEAGQNNCGFIHANFSGTEEYWITKQYYTMGNFCKFIKPGFTIIRSDNSEVLAAFDTSSNKLVIVVRNNSDSDISYKYDLTKFTDITASVATPYRTSSTETLIQLSNISISNRNFTATAKAKSVTTYIISGVSYVDFLNVNDELCGIGINQFEYAGNWSYYNNQSSAYMNDNHYSNTSNNYFQIKFNGSQIKLYGAQDPAHGIAAVSIDGGAETNIDYYGTNRVDNTLLYTSPVLTSGQHTLKVRVTGTKNASSSGYFITVDRVSVFNNNNYNNISLGKSATSDSQQSGNVAASGNDGSTMTRWCANDGNLNHWWKVDLGSNYDLKGSEVFWEQNGKNYKYKIEISPDSTNWTLKIDKTANTSKEQTQTDYFTASSARYVRITVTGLESGVWASIKEFKVFSTSGPNTINNNATGTGNNEFEYSGSGWNYYNNQSGAYSNDNHYCGTANSYFFVDFNGSQIKLYGAQDPAHGIAAVSIDGGAETNIDYYGTNRVDNTLLYTSPVLTSGQHTLKVRVTGTKNASSSGYNITADRVDITN